MGRRVGDIAARKTSAHSSRSTTPSSVAGRPETPVAALTATQTVTPTPTQADLLMLVDEHPPYMDESTEPLPPLTEAELRTRAEQRRAYEQVERSDMLLCAQLMETIEAANTI